jgi:pimeloyl-ACP methyl ester carboxylesterase
MNHVTEGQGPPLLLIHGGAEDASMHAPQAAAFAQRGRRVIRYDRRGTGGSPRAGWPESGVAGHADDAAALLRALDAVPATVLGFSSGGVVALALAARHPELVSKVIAWEPAALGMLPGGLAMHAHVMAPAEAHLAAHPGDWHGAAVIPLDLIAGGRADRGSPVYRAALRNAEALVRDDGAIITRTAFGPGEVPADKCVVAIGKGPARSTPASRRRSRNCSASRPWSSTTPTSTRFTSLGRTFSLLCSAPTRRVQRTHSQP